MKKRVFLYKRIALLMAICYVMNILQYQISPIMHKISHILDVPSGLISHESSTTTEYGIHNHEDHITANTKHEHNIIELIEKIIETSNDADTSDTVLLSEVKIHKHFFEYEYSKHLLFARQKSHDFVLIKQKEKSGHPIKSKEPPRLV